MGTLKYKRILLKLSGESFCRPGGFGIEFEALESIAGRIAQLGSLGCQVALVVGGGNFMRGRTFSKGGPIGRNTADFMGMLATVMNACALQEALERLGAAARVLSAIDVPALCEHFVRRKCLDHLDSGRIVILAGGTGNPFFSTDTCAALRAAELGVDVIIKATKVDGVYTDDPVENQDAKLIKEISYQEVLQDNLKVIDPAAISLCSENGIPIIVLNIFREGHIEKALLGEKVGTMIS